MDLPWTGFCGPAVANTWACQCHIPLELKDARLKSLEQTMLSYRSVCLNDHRVLRSSTIAYLRNRLPAHGR